MSEQGPTNTAAPPISVRAYARHRKALGLNGGSAPAVLKAIGRGRLKLSLVLEDGNAKIADVALADREWSENTDLSRAPSDVKERSARQSLPLPSALSAQPPVQSHKPPAPPPPPEQTQPATPASTPPRPVDESAIDAKKPADLQPTDQLDPEQRWKLNDAAAEEKKWKALKAQIEYQQLLGELVPAKDVEDATAQLFATVRTKLLGVPAKARAASPHWTLPDVDLVDRLIREALEELAAPDLTSPDSTSQEHAA